MMISFIIYYIMRIQKVLFKKSLEYINSLREVMTTFLKYVTLYSYRICEVAINFSSYYFKINGGSHQVNR